MEYLDNLSNIISLCITAISIIASGVISWLISNRYYKKGNRDNVRVSILLPMKQLLEEKCSNPFRIKPETLTAAKKLSEEYSAQYLKKNERALLSSVLDKMEAVQGRSDREKYVEGIFHCFIEAIKENGIEPECVPMPIGDPENPDSFVYTYPNSFDYLKLDLRKAYDDCGWCSTNAELAQQARSLIGGPWKEIMGNDHEIPSLEKLSVAALNQQYVSEWKKDAEAFKAARNTFLQIKT